MPANTVVQPSAYSETEVMRRPLALLTLALVTVATAAATPTAEVFHGGDTRSYIARAGSIPVIGAWSRRDLVHLDVVVNCRKVSLPAGIGLAEPADTGHSIFAQAANSPLHTHDGSGMVHVESDRLLPFTL